MLQWASLFQGLLMWLLDSESQRIIFRMAVGNPFANYICMILYFYVALTPIQVFSIPPADRRNRGRGGTSRGNQSSSYNENGLHIMPLASFPNGKFVALHMPCEESNMFATKCMCHLKCTSKDCSNAKELCQKYSDSKGCRYILTRPVGKQGIATLKRDPTKEEAARFDISGYPSTSMALETGPWANASSEQTKLKVKLSDLVEGAKDLGRRTVEALCENPTRSQPLCPQPPVDFRNDKDVTAWKDNFLNQSISLFALNYNSPRTLINSLTTWKSSGLLDMVAEKYIFLNDARPDEIAMSRHHNLEVILPQHLNGVKLAKQRVITIGTAFYQALRMSTSEYVLFLENDFKVDTSLTKEAIQNELVAAAGMLQKGAEVVRLQSRKYQGCGTFKSCDHHGIHLDNPDPMERRRNWFAFYCQGHPGSKAYVSDCLSEPLYRCFSSWDSNWSLNAVLVKKSTMLSKQYATRGGRPIISIAEVGHMCHNENDCFERQMSWDLKWMEWKVPICISYNGLFIHEEIETGT